MKLSYSIKSPRSGSDLLRQEIANVGLLGSHETLEWSQAQDGLTIRMPSKKPCDNAYGCKIVFKA